jgi:phospholipid/cholesterol/gamma-HCH transport system substrate-binding protein
MKRNVIETVLGAVVLIGALVFLVFSYTMADIKQNVDSGYELTANFSTTGGLGKGDVVTVSGVQVGSVKDVSLDPTSYNAKVTMLVRNDVKIPSDSSAAITSESLLGGKIMMIQPGAEDVMLESGGQIEFTQAPQSLEELLGKFIFSVTEDKGGGAAPAEDDVSAAAAGDDTQTSETPAAALPPM